MMNSFNSRIARALVAACAIAVPLIQVDHAAAVDRFWQGDVNSDYRTTTNWDQVTNPGATGLVSPRASNSERAVIGTDDPNGALNSKLAPFGSPVVTTATAPPGGVALGLRVIDYDDLDFDGMTDDFLHDVEGVDFDETTLVGMLTIGPGGNLAPVSTPAAGVGADGRVLVGVHGRGYLTMTGGTLTAPALIVDGINVTTDAGTANELGPSLVDLSGTADVNINGNADINRRLKVTGPSVNFDATGRIRFVAASSYTAAITSATAHSPLRTTNNALLGGSLSIEFSGAAATRDPIASLGQTWTLIDSSLSENAIDGNFANLGSGGTVQVTGLDAAHAAPLGGTYRVKKVASGGHSLLQLSYEQVLILTVDRDTGEMTIRNPYDGQIAIDAYSVTSARGSMNTSYAGFGNSTPGAGIWVKPTAPGGNTVNALSEVKEPDFSVPIGNEDAYDLFTVDSVSLGNGFNRTGVAANVANFGFDGEDLIFEYGGPSTGDVPIRGHIEYIGTKFENDLVLRVNPNTGQAYLKNDSLVTLKFDGYSILSSTGNLNGGGFTGLGGTWESSPATANALSQTNLDGSTTLAPGAQLSIGDVSLTGFTTDEIKAGLSLQFILAEGLTSSGAPGGDYNNDGTVNAADYTFWRDNLGASITLTNVNPAATTPGVVDQEDYNYWKAQFGQTGGPVPEATFRTGSVVFDATAGSGGGGLAGAAVPEPSTGLMMLLGLGTIGLVRRSAKPPAVRPPVRAARCPGTWQKLGAHKMISKRMGVLMTAMASFSAVLLTTLPAAAVTQGIPLVNGDMELPGPTGTKVVAFDDTGAPISGIIPSWTFVGPGVSTFGDGIPGDSGTEGGGNPGNEMLLSTHDGVVYQTSAFNVVSIPATQKYRLSFDARNIFTPTGLAELTARLYYLAPDNVTRTTIGSPLVMPALGGGHVNFAIEFVGGSAALTPALGRPIGVEFDTTSLESDPTVTESWAGIDNVILQIAGVTAGDLNGDGLVNTTDYGIIRDNLQKPNLYMAAGELTGDSFVDLDDFRAFKNLYNSPGSGTGGLGGSNIPEPSTFVLAFAAAAMFAGAFSARKRRATAPTSSLLMAAVAISAALLSAAESQAELLAYDPIDNTPGTGAYVDGTLAGQNPTIGPASPSFFRDPWTLGFAGQVVQPGTLQYFGSPSAGGSINGFGRTERYLTTAWDDTTVGTYYMSFHVNFGTIATGDMGYRAVEFFPAGVVPGENRIGDIGYNQFFSQFGDAQRNGDTAKMQFNMNVAAHQIIPNAPDNFREDGLIHLLVMKFVLNNAANSDSVSLFLDPTSVDEPVIPSALVTGVNWSLGSVGSASFGGAGPTTVFDEIRVGTEFIDVLPEFPLPGDTNGDDMVDHLDYQAIISHMNLSGQSLANGDVNGDGRVTIADYRFWKERRTDLTPLVGGGSAAGIGVPEPATWILALIVGCATAIWSRRR